MAELKRFDVEWMRKQIDDACTEAIDRLRHEAERLKHDADDLKAHAATASNVNEAEAIWVKTFAASGPLELGANLEAYGTGNIVRPNGDYYNRLPLADHRDAATLKPGRRYKVVLTLFDLGPNEKAK